MITGLSVGETPNVEEPPEPQFKRPPINPPAPPMAPEGSEGPDNPEYPETELYFSISL